MEENIVNIFFLLFKSLYFNIEYSKYSFISLFLIGARHYLHFFCILLTKLHFVLFYQVYACGWKITHLPIASEILNSMT